MFICTVLLAAVLLQNEQGGIALKIESETTAVDPGRSVFLRVEMKVPAGKSAALPDLRERVTGFLQAEDYEDAPVTDKDGSTLLAANWKLVPEPCAETYKIRPFVAGDFYWGPIYFENPPSREPVTGGWELGPMKRDLWSALSWKLAGFVTLALLALAALGYGLFVLVRHLIRRVKEHRMSPIERAWVELDRLIRKGLPGRGRYKDFYVELTMVVRRYVQRKYGIKAPHLTTEEFLQQATRWHSSDAADGQTLTNTAALEKFLESADLVKFAGVEATPDMADGATESARGYLTSDAKAVA